MKQDSTSPSELEREIRELLKVDPAPDFVLRTRLRIASAPPASSNMGWLLVASSALAAAIILAVVLTRPHALPPSEIASVVVPPTVTASLPAHAALRPAPVSRIATVRKAEPEVLIAPEETAAIQRLLTKGPIQWTEFSAETIEPKPLAQLTLTPLTILDSMTMEPIQQAATLPKGDLQ